MINVKSAQTIDRMNRYGKEGTPFIFIVDFEMQMPLVMPVEDVRQEAILYNFNGFTNQPDNIFPGTAFSFEKFPVGEDKYKKSFDLVMKHLRFGNSYLTNLTFPTRIRTNLSLPQLYHLSQARYKIHYSGLFTVFSPEIFVQVRDGYIFSYPMKGTIDASIPDAERIILRDEKELAEHNTIVDLIRNDLSMVSDHVRVIRFRYIDRLRTTHKDLLQVSSEIRGELPVNYREQIGTILFTLLPAGSVSGAPKKKTVEIIREAETYNRGYYTGVAGHFDGTDLDCGVLIRFIEKTPEGLVYKSGGGITVRSMLKKEYCEMIDKVYVPID
jgi:para-aminobenzoate synthetase component 1